MRIRDRIKGLRRLGAVTAARSLGAHADVVLARLEKLDADGRVNVQRAQLLEANRVWETAIGSVPLDVAWAQLRASVVVQERLKLFAAEKDAEAAENGLQSALTEWFEAKTRADLIFNEGGKARRAWTSACDARALAEVEDRSAFGSLA